MKTVSIALEDDLLTSLEILCAHQQRDQQQVLVEAVQRYVETESLRRELSSPELVGLYAELSAEDLQLAETGLGEFDRSLREADRS